MSVRVLHITRDAPPRDNGGISTALRLLMDAVGEAHDIYHRFVSFDGWKPRKNTGDAALDEVTRDGVRLSAPAQLEAAKHWALEAKPNVIHIHDPLVFDFADRIASELGAPTLYTVHIGHTQANRVRNIDGTTRSSREETAALQSVDRIHVASRHLEDLMHQESGRPKEDVSLVRWPVPVPNEIGIGVDRTPLIVSRFGYLKGTDLAFDVLSQWFEQDGSVTTEWHGGLPDSAKSERRWLRKWTSAADESSVEQLQFKGWSARREILTEYAMGRLFISTSRHESFGLSVAEAMAHGCATAVVPAGALDELIEDGISGCALPSKDGSERIVNRLRELHQSPDYRQTLGSGARRRIRTLCDPEVQGKAFARLYHSLA